MSSLSSKGRMGMEDKEFYNLSSEVKALNIKLEKDTEKFIFIIKALEEKIDNLKIQSGDMIDKDIQSLQEKIDDLKAEVWELKSSKKHITQNEKDIAVLSEQVKGNSTLMDSYKREIEAQMVTRKELDDKKYKDWRLWLGVVGVIIAIGIGTMNYFKIENTQKNGSENVLPNYKK